MRRRLPITHPTLTGDVRQTWPGKRWWQKPGPWCRTKRCTRVAVEAEPYEFLLSLALGLFGIRAVLSPSSATPSSISQLPDGVTVLYCLLSVVAGVVTLTGLLAGCHQASEPGCAPDREKRWAPGVEMAGLFLSAAAWLSYLVGIISTISTARSTLLGLALIALALANLLRARRVWRDQVDRLRALQQIRAQIRA